jgi:hypothetical protein
LDVALVVVVAAAGRAGGGGVRAEDPGGPGLGAGVLLVGAPLGQDGPVALGVALGLGRALVEVQVGVDLDHRAAGADDLVEHGLELLGPGLLEGAGLAGAQVAGRARGALLARGEQHVALGVGDGDLVRVQALDAGGDQVVDGADLVGAQIGRGPGLDQDRGARLLVGVGEHVLGRDDQVDGGAVDALDGLDGLGQLAFHRALEVDPLAELAGGHALLVQQGVAVGAAGRQALGAGVQAGLVDLVARHHDRGAAVGQRVGDALGVQLLGDGRRVGRVQVAEQGRVAGLARPLGEREATEREGEHGDDDDRALPRREAGVDPGDALADDVQEVHQTCILMISLKASTALLRTATVSSVATWALLAAIM